MPKGGGVGLGSLSMKEEGLGLDSGVWKRELTGPCVTGLFPVKYNRSLSCSRVTLLSQKQCETFYPGVITNNMICAGMDRDQDSCQVRISKCLGWGVVQEDSERAVSASLLSHPQSTVLPNLYPLS